MGQIINRDGVLIEDMGDGTGRVVGYADAPAASPSSTPSATVLPVNPVRAAREAQEEARRQREEARAAAKDAEDTRRWNLSHNPDGTPKKAAGEGGVDSAKARADAMTGYTSATSIRRLVADLRNKYKAGPGSTGGVAGALDYLPTAANRDFDAAGNSLRGFVGSALGFTGGQLNSVAEAEASVGPYLPKAGDYDEVIEGKLSRLEQLANDAETRSIAMLGGRPDANGNITPVDGQPQQRADNEVPDPTTGAATKPDETDDPEIPGAVTSAASGKFRFVDEPRVNETLNALMSNGASESMINAVLKKNDLPVIRPDQYREAMQWVKANPGMKYTSSNVQRAIPLNVGQKIAGSAPGAFLATMANSATAGIPAALAGPAGQGAIDAMSAMNPNAALAGSVLGGVTGMMGAEAALAAKAPAALAKYAPRIADTLYGGLLGFNTAQDGEGGTGALKGAAAGLAGGFLGQKAMNAAGSALRGVRDPSVQYLRARGVPMTVGQAVGNGGVIGRGVKKIEDALTSVPFAGNMVDARRLEGMEAFNRAAFNAGGEPIGAQIDDMGASAIQRLMDAKSAAYRNALDPATIDVAADSNLIPDMTTAALNARSIPQVGDAAAEALEYRIGGGVDNNGMMSGRDFQEAYRGLGRDGRAAATGSYANEVAGTMREGQNALAGALEGQNPGAFQGFLQANQANRNLNVLADAVNQAKANGGVFTPNQLNMKDAASTVRLNGNIASAAGNRPFFDLAEAGQAVLPSKLADSGTWTRLLVGGGATGLLGGGGALAGGTDGATTGTGLGLGATLLLAAGGSKPAQSILTKALIDRPDLAVTIGDTLRKNSRIGGWTGAGTLAPLFVGQ